MARSLDFVRLYGVFSGGFTQIVGTSMLVNFSNESITRGGVFRLNQTQLAKMAKMRCALQGVQVAGVNSINPSRKRRGPASSGAPAH
jgi:hypothetical protein